MTIVTLTSSESRHSKALALLVDSGQWIRNARLHDGHRVIGMPSQRVRGQYHWTDGRTCSCKDFERRQRACKHVLAYRLDAIAQRESPRPQPASDTLDGLNAMLAARLADPRVRRYDDIFARFEEE